MSENTNVAYKSLAEVTIKGGNKYETIVRVAVTEHIESGQQFFGFRKMYLNKKTNTLLPTDKGLNIPIQLLAETLEVLLPFVGAKAPAVVKAIPAAKVAPVAKTASVAKTAPVAVPAEKKSASLLDVLKEAAGDNPALKIALQKAAEKNDIEIPF